MNCNPIQLDSGQWRCERCGVTSKLPLGKPFRARCVIRQGARWRLSENKTDTIESYSCNTCSMKQESELIMKHSSIQDIDQSFTGENGERYYRCIHCGDVIGPVKEADLNHECSSPVQDKVPVGSPTILNKIVNYALAYIEHVKTGRNECTFREILDRFHHCSSCEMYNDTNATCSECGCYVNLLLAKDGANKLSWCDSECPRKHFGKISR